MSPTYILTESVPEPEPADLSQLAMGQPICYPGTLRQATPEELLS